MADYFTHVIPSVSGMTAQAAGMQQSQLAYLWKLILQEMTSAQQAQGALSTCYATSAYNTLMASSNAEADGAYASMTLGSVTTLAPTISSFNRIIGTKNLAGTTESQELDAVKANRLAFEGGIKARAIVAPQNAPNAVGNPADLKGNFRTDKTNDLSRLGREAWSPEHDRVADQLNKDEEATRRAYDAKQGHIDYWANKIDTFGQGLGQVGSSVAMTYKAHELSNQADCQRTQTQAQFANDTQAQDVQMQQQAFSTVQQIQTGTASSTISEIARANQPV